MLVIDPREDTDTAFWAEVTLTPPGGKPSVIRVKYREITQSDLDDHYEAGGNDLGLLERVVCDWDGVYGPPAAGAKAGRGPAIPWDDTVSGAVALAAQRPWVRTGLARSYVAHITGNAAPSRRERQRGN